MEKRSTLVQQCTTLILAVCMSVGNAVAGYSQAGSVSAPTPEQLDKLLAPIALYPDALLTQVLAVSVDAQEVLDGGNWLLQNKGLEGDQLESAAKAAGFGPAMMALFHFPQIIDMMCSEIDWTRQLGAAFAANQQRRLCQVLFRVFSALFFIFIAFLGRTTPFTPKSGLICSAKLHFDDHGSLRNLSIGFSPTYSSLRSVPRP